MKKIAILRCLKSNDVCTGAACLSSFNNKTGKFSVYDDELQLVAFMTCNGCGSVDLHNEAGLREKLDMIKKIPRMFCMLVSVPNIKQPEGDILFVHTLKKFFVKSGK